MKPPLYNTQKAAAAWLDSPFGTLLAVADASHLLFLKFMDRATLMAHAPAIEDRLGMALAFQRNSVIDLLDDELTAYFAGRCKHFETPLQTSGTEFQRAVWNELVRIPYGKTASYSELAARVGRPAAFRAAAQANARNPVHVIIPCHRVINNNGELGGYSAGLDRKCRLLELEAAGAQSTV